MVLRFVNLINILLAPTSKNGWAPRWASPGAPYTLHPAQSWTSFLIISIKYCTMFQFLVITAWEGEPVRATELFHNNIPVVHWRLLCLCLECYNFSCFHISGLFSINVVLLGQNTKSSNSWEFETFTNTLWAAGICLWTFMVEQDLVWLLTIRFSIRTWLCAVRTKVLKIYTQYAENEYMYIYI